MGYLFVFILGLAALVVVVIAATHNKQTKQGRIPGGGTAILRDEPSADAPTPAWSSTATKSEVRAAEKLNPPA